MKKKFTILGGDMRSIYLAYSLLEDGKDVKIFGFDAIKDELKIEEEDSFKNAIKDSDVIIGPLPFSRDGKTINAPFTSKAINIGNVFKMISKEQTLIIGKADKDILALAKKKNIHIEDYFLREEMQILNAIPTSEGAIQVAMDEMNTTIHGSNVMVLGYGRIGKILAKMLNGIGANIFVVARKYCDTTWIKANGYTPVLLKDMDEYVNNMDIVFNTIPSLVLDKKLLNKLSKDCLVIDLASKPGGVDLESAKELGIKVKWELGVPGKVAPITAANAIKEAVYNIIVELEE